MPDEESGVRVTCQEEDTEVRKEHNVCRLKKVMCQKWGTEERCAKGEGSALAEERSSMQCTTGATTKRELSTLGPGLSLPIRAQHP